MARCEWNIPGFVKGAYGDVVFCHGRHGMYVRRRAKASPKPPSAEQLTHRKRFAACILFYRALDGQGMAKAWKREARRGIYQPVNLFIRENLACFTAEGKVGDYDRLCLTRGRLELSPGLRVMGSGGGEVRVEWEPEERPWRGMPEDRLRAVVMDGTDSYEIRPADTGGARRGDFRATIRFPPAEGGEGHLYLFFEAEGGGDFSTAKHFEL